MPPNFFEIIGFSIILMFCRKIVCLLLLVTTKVSNLIGKSLNLATLYYRYHDASDMMSVKSGKSFP